MTDEPKEGVTHAEILAELKGFRELYDRLSEQRDVVMREQASALKAMSESISKVECDLAVANTLLASRNEEHKLLAAKVSRQGERLRAVEVRTALYVGAGAVLSVVGSVILGYVLKL